MNHTKIIYGIHAVSAALSHHPENVLNIYCQSKQNKNFELIFDQALQMGVNIENCSETQLNHLTQSPHHQGIAAKIRFAQAEENDLIQWLETAKRPLPLLLLLEGIQDPHNLGACLRTANALGVDWIVVSKAHTAPMNATVSKVACGADQTLPIVSVSNLVRFVERIKSMGIWVIGTSDKASQSLDKVDLNRPLALIMGSEGKGLKRLTLSTCDEVAKIPLVGTVSSLNVSVATGICLYECLRQRIA